MSRQFFAWFVFLYLGILPGIYFSKEDPRQRIRAQSQRVLELRQIIGHANRAGAFRDFQCGLHLLQLVVVERSVAGAEVDQSLFELLYAPTASNRLVVDLYPLMCPLERTDPAGHNRVNERAARAYDAGTPTRTHRAGITATGDEKHSRSQSCKRGARDRDFPEHVPSFPSPQGLCLKVPK